MSVIVWHLVFSKALCNEASICFAKKTLVKCKKLDLYSNKWNETIS